MTFDLLVYDYEEDEEVWVEDVTAFDYSHGELYIATTDHVRYFVAGSEAIGANSDENDNTAFPQKDD